MQNISSDEERIQISGSVLEVIYRNPINDYTVIELISDADEQLTCVGILPMVHEDDEVILYGKWARHPEHGRQFQADAFEKRLPSDVNSILRYLSSKNVKGVGPVTALKIVNRFGIDSFDVIEHHPEWLTDINGITPKKAAEINKSFCEEAGMRHLMILCRDYISSGAVTRIYKQLGGNAVNRIKENPYCLCRTVSGIGFEKSDAMARDMGFDMHSPLRIVSGAAYLLQYHAQLNGHSCMPFDKVVMATAALLELSEEEVRASLLSSESERDITRYTANDGTVYAYAAHIAFLEDRIVKKLLTIDREAPQYAISDAALLSERIETELNITFDPLQRQAIYDSLRSGVTILTGGPGTGKTTVIRGLIRIFSSMNIRFALAAPTGRAAKRMSEATSEEAKTVHRMLEMESGKEGEPQFHRNEDNPLSESVIIVDEASMLDIPLTEALLRAVPRKGRIIFIGDADQLPSVGAGNVLCDLIASNCFCTVKLTQIFRQNEESLIVNNAHRINQGEMPELSRKDRDFFFLERNFDADIAKTVTALVSERLPKAYGEEILSDLQTISPSRRGQSGTESLNILLQSALNPHDPKKKELRFKEKVFRIGDRVMQTKNNYDISWQKNGVDGVGIYNGDIGTLVEINDKEEQVSVEFEDKLATYDFSLLEELEHAYAITVHKSQGSEYGTVIIPLYSCPPMLRTRNLLYTAVTRAKKRVILVGRKDILREMIENDRQDFRYTLLSEKIQNKCKKA